MAAKKRDRLEWQTLVAQWQRSGETAKDFAKKHGLNANTLKWWKSHGLSGKRRSTKPRKKESTGTPRLVPLRVRTAPTEVAVRVAPLELAIDGAVLRFAAGTAPSYVGELVAALRRPSC